MLPSSIDIVEIGNITSTSAIVFTYIESNEPLSEAKLILSNNNDVDTVNIKSDRSFTVSNLKPGEDYIVSAFIKTKNDVTYSSNDKTFTTEDFNVEFESDSVLLGNVFGYELLLNNPPEKEEEFNITVGGLDVPFELKADNRIILHFKLATEPGMQPLAVAVNGKEIFRKDIYVPPFGRADHPGYPPFAFRVGGILAFDDAIFNVMSVYVDNINVDGGEVHTNDVWKFDLEKERWTRLSGEFPNERRNYPLSVTVNGKGYLGFGSSDGEFFQDFWEFDPSSQSWTQLPSPPVNIDDHPRYVVKDNLIYIHDQNDNFISYNVESSEWEVLKYKELTPVNLKPRYQSYNLQFVFDNNLYFLTENLTLSIFNPATKEWIAETIYDDSLRLTGYSSTSKRFFHYVIGTDLYVGYDYDRSKKVSTLYKLNLETGLSSTNVYEFNRSGSGGNFGATQNEENVFLNFGTSCLIIKKVAY
ncbi:hypothetical protein SAMN05661096_01526 [Marivirga sericea]|uniref:Kelch motif-containing protein n=1 Tax=Marivirga sericea TaxID=1028 RepID=A0A1X7JBW8_9BACT|nr:hypothetical protein [Marivirga sericea]SMG25145.1 hypothetical protein SAMN05661096_01526 [Marivirga sericea]